jgi:hypothetical protein
LIELLVVIAILAALLRPALARTKAEAWRVQCLNNLKQLQVGAALYFHDNGGVLLPNSWGTDNVLPALQPYAWCNDQNETWTYNSENTN